MQASSSSAWAQRIASDLADYSYDAVSALVDILAWLEALLTLD
jgi:hypothetical protein